MRADSPSPSSPPLSRNLRAFADSFETAYPFGGATGRFWPSARFPECLILPARSRGLRDSGAVAPSAAAALANRHALPRVQPAVARRRRPPSGRCGERSQSGRALSPTFSSVRTELVEVPSFFRCRCKNKEQGFDRLSPNGDEHGLTSWRCTPAVPGSAGSRRGIRSSPWPAPRARRGRSSDRPWHRHRRRCACGSGGCGCSPATSRRRG